VSDGTNIASGRVVVGHHFDIRLIQICVQKMKAVVWLSLLSLVVASSHDTGISSAAAPPHERGLKGSRRTTAAATTDRRTIDSQHRELDIFKKFHKTMMLLRWKLALMKQGGASVLENALASNYPSAMPSDSPSLAPSDVPSTAPSFAPSSPPSLIPTLLPTYKPTRVPSSTPSSAPSDAPSVPPSDVPSLAPSDVPSMIPSDTPSATPELFADVFEATESFTEDSEFCAAAPANAAAVTETADVTVLYAYKLELVPGARVLAVTRSIEALLHTVLIDSLCSSDNTVVVGVSPRPLDVPGGTCTRKSTSCQDNGI
jgi:hypothetical protein